MCFAPQCRTLSQQLTFQKCSEPEVLVTFWLRNVLCAAAAGNFSTSQLPKVLREWNVFLAFWLPNLLRATMTCNFWSLLPKWLRTRRFSEPTFRPSGATKHRKDTVFRGFSTFRAPWSCFYWPFLFWLLFSLFLFSASSHLCCFICPYCRKFDF